LAATWATANLASTGHPGVSPAITRANSSARSNIFTALLLQTCLHQVSTALKRSDQDCQHCTPLHSVARLRLLASAQFDKGCFQLSQTIFVV